VPAAGVLGPLPPEAPVAVGLGLDARARAVGRLLVPRGRGVIAHHRGAGVRGLAASAVLAVPTSVPEPRGGAVAAMMAMPVAVHARVAMAPTVPGAGLGAGASQRSHHRYSRGRALTPNALSESYQSVAPFH
jgi:hypothetical protein